MNKKKPHKESRIKRKKINKKTQLHYPTFKITRLIPINWKRKKNLKKKSRK